MTELSIQHRDNGRRGIFFIAGDGADELLAEMTYHYHDPETVVIEHTGVREALRGQGVAGKLVDSGVAFAREQGLVIAPVCPYARRVLTGDASYDDVLAESWHGIVFHDAFE